jgi:uncharacterized protein YerC
MGEITIRQRRGEENRMLRLMKRHEIQVLLRAHHTHKRVAELTGVSISSVRRVAKGARRTHR